MGGSAKPRKNSASGGFGVWGEEQVTDDADPGRTKRGSFGDSIGIQAADAEKGHGDLATDFPDFGGTDGFVVGLGPRGVERTKAEVIGAKSLTRFGLAGEWVERPRIVEEPSCFRASGMPKSSWPR